MGVQNSSQNEDEGCKGEEDEIFPIVSPDFDVKEAEMVEKFTATDKDIRWEQHVLENKLLGMHLHMCFVNGKKKLKEINDLVKQERAKLILICEKSYVQNNQELSNLQLPQQREFENLLLRQVGILEEEHHAGQQSTAVVSETTIETGVGQEATKNALPSMQKKLLQVRGNIRTLERAKATFSKQLDAINIMLNSTDEDTAIPTSTCDSRSEEMPWEELMQKSEELEADFTNFQLKQDSYTQQRIDICEEALKREQENLELKLRDLKAETYQRNKTLNEFGELIRWKSVNLERLSRKKVLEIKREGIMVRLLYFREAESLFLRRIGLIGQVEVFYREKYGGGNDEDEKELQEVLQFQRERIEKNRKEMSLVRDNILLLEEEEMSLSKELDATNKEICDNDEGMTI